MKHPKFSLVLPCYNESEHFNVSIQKITSVLKKCRFSHEIIFIEDSSTDGTQLLLREFMKNNSKLPFSAIFHDKNQGRGKAVTDGILKAKGEFVGFIDIDCEISPKYIPEFVEKLMQGFDVIIGIRQYEIDRQGIIRALASKIYISIVQFILRTKLSDTESGYKFFKKSRILSVLKKVEDSGWFWDTEIMIRAEKKNLKIYSFPVVFKRNHEKTSTVNLIPDSLNYLKKLISFSFTSKY